MEEKKNLQINPAPFNKKLKAYFIDFGSIILLSLLICIISISIFINSTYYKKQDQTINNQIDIMLKLTKEANLSDEDENGNILDLNDLYKKYAIGHILLSFNIDPTSFTNSNYTDIKNHEQIKDKYFPIDVKTDYLANIYYNYFPNLNGEFNQPKYTDASTYFKEVLTTVNKDLSCFNMNLTYPTLKGEFAVSLYEYIVLEKKVDNQKGLDNNTLFADIFTKTFSYNSEQFQKLTFYQKEYNIYYSSYQSLAYITNLIYVLSYTISFVILTIFVSIMNKNHITLGYKLTSLKLHSIRDKKIKFYQIVLKFLFEYLISFSSIFIISLLIGGNALTFPLFNISTFNINLFSFTILSFILLSANILTSYIKKDKRSLSELLSNTIYIDLE